MSHICVPDNAGFTPRVTAANARRIARNPMRPVDGFEYLSEWDAANDACAQPTLRTHWLAEVDCATTVQAVAVATQLLLSATNVAKISLTERREKEADARAVKKAVMDIVHQIERTAHLETRSMPLHCLFPAFSSPPTAFSSPSAVFDQGHTGGGERSDQGR